MCASVLSGDDGAAPGWFVLASLVAASRVYVRMHHTSDVVGGAVLGLVLAKFARRLLT
jgi:undecaprenyl-diphosphatase